MLRTRQSLTGNNAETAFNLNLSAIIRLLPEFVYLLPLHKSLCFFLFENLRQTSSSNVPQHEHHSSTGHQQEGPLYQTGPA